MNQTLEKFNQQVDELRSANAEIGELLTAEVVPEIYTRANVKQNASGEYYSDTTVSVTGAHSLEWHNKLMRQLLIDADTIARDEIERRKSLDQAAEDEVAF